MFCSSSSSPLSPLPSSSMEYGVDWYRRPYTSSSAPYSHNPPPPATPASSVDSLQWLNPGGFHSGGGRGALVGAAPVQTLPSISPYSIDALGSAFSDLSFREYLGRLPYNLEAAATGGYGLNVDLGSRLNYSSPHASSFMDQESSDFDVSRSTFHQNLADHDFYHSSAADRFRNFARSSSLYPNYPITDGYGGSRWPASDLVGQRLRETCVLADCSCHYNPSAADQYVYQRRRQHLALQNFSAHTPFTISPSNRMSTRRHSRPRLDLDLNSINLMKLKGRVVAFARDQDGCRILQSKLKDPTAEEVEMVLSEVLDHVTDLMIHSFGNYLIQKLIDVCTEEQRSRLLASVIRDSQIFIYTCFDNHGTRAVQKLLEKLTSPYQIFQFMFALAPGVVDLIKDVNGHHVIKHCLKNFPAELNEYLLKEVADNCFGIATDKSGCCVIQQCVDTSEGEIRERLIFNIISDALLLAEDRFGNYVVQHVLEHHQLGARIVNQLEGNFIQLSCNKFASHVVEKCMTKTSINEATLVMNELVKSPKLPELLLDQYGNFVYQAALSKSLSLDAQVYEKLRKLVQSNVSSMRNNMFGKKILEWFERNGQPLFSVYCSSY